MWLNAYSLRVWVAYTLIWYRTLCPIAQSHSARCKHTIEKIYLYIFYSFFSLSLSRTHSVSLSLFLCDTFTQFCWVKMFYLFVFDPDLKYSAFLESDQCVSNILVGLWCYWLLYHYFKIEFRFCKLFFIRSPSWLCLSTWPVCFFSFVIFIVLIRFLFFSFCSTFHIWLAVHTIQMRFAIEFKDIGNTLRLSFSFLTYK